MTARQSADPADPADPHHPRTARVAAALYALLAGALAGGVFCFYQPVTPLSPPQLLLPCALVLAAVAVERTSRRTVSASPAIGAASSVYAASCLLVPAAWAVVVAAAGATLCHLPRRHLGLTPRLVAIAQPLATAAVFAALVGRVVGLVSGGHGFGGLWAAWGAPIPYQGTVATPGHPPIATLLHSPVSATTMCEALAALAVAYAVLDMGSAALAARVGRTPGSRGAGAGHGAWRPRPVATGAAPCLGVMVAILFAVSPPLAILGALPALALPAAGRLCRDPESHGGEARLPATLAGASGGRTHTPSTPVSGGRIETIAPYSGTPSPGPPTPAPAIQPDPAPGRPPRPGDETVTPQRDLLEATLAAVRAIGGDTDLARVTGALALAAPRLTTFRACAVYLYESRDGVFVAHARSLGRRLLRDMIALDEVEALMDERHGVGYSYYAPRPARDATPAGVWLPGDTLLVPLLTAAGDVVGYIQLDDPADRCIPDASALAPIETVASLAANVIARLRHTDEALQLAATDGLTGLLNRRSLEDRLHREYAAAERRRRPLALLMIDIDDFGAVNNTHGHQVGDAALRLVSGIIRAHVHGSDVGGRYGGDEFAVLLPGRDAEEAAVIAERLRAALVEATTRAAQEGTLPLIHTSIGVAASPSDARDPAALLKAADDALYESKRMGKNCVSRYRAA